jgi:hypothetical protein
MTAKVFALRAAASLLIAGALVAGCASSTQTAQRAQSAPPAQTEQNTYDQTTVMRAATGVFGEGAEGLGKVVERIFADLGRPNGYIVGQEFGGALIGGLRYGDGQLFHKVEGERKVHWTGPSVGFDIGGDAAKAFVLVYNLYDSQDIFQRFPQVEGKVFFIGGFAVSYLQRGNVVLAPIRLGAGWRLGANIGYMKITADRAFFPF